MWECRGFVDLLPPHVYVEQTEGDPEAIGEVWPEELRAISDAVPRRRGEFATTRACARRALQRMGVAPRAIPVGADRGPVWPPGVVGSLTHAAGLHVAAVASATSLRGIGIDVEPNRELPGSTLDLAAGDSETADLSSLNAAWPMVAWDRLLFSAKEAIFKAWFPATGHWLDFRECELSIDAAAGTFTGRLRLARGLGRQFGVETIEGRWGLSGPRILTAVALPVHPCQ